MPTCVQLFCLPVNMCHTFPVLVLTGPRNHLAGLQSCVTLALHNWFSLRDLQLFGGLTA